MVSEAIGTAAASSAYFFGGAFSSNSLNESDPIKGQPLPLPYYLWVFGFGLVFWLLVLLWPKLHYSGGVLTLHTGDKDPGQKDIRDVAKQITAITTINLCGCLVLPFRKLPLQVRFLVLFQLSSNLALLLICFLLSIHKYIMPECQLILYESLTKSKISSSALCTTKKDESVVKAENLFIGKFNSNLRLQSLDSLLQYKGKSDVKDARKGSAIRDETRAPTANLYTVREDGDGYEGEAGTSGSEHARDGRVSSSILCPTTTDESLHEAERYMSELRLELDSLLPSIEKRDVIGEREGSAVRGETRPTSNLYPDRGDGYGVKLEQVEVNMPEMVLG